MKFLLTCILVVLTSGCATSLDQQRDTLQLQQNCCADLSELPFQTLDPVKRHEVKLDDQNALVYIFDGGHKSYFAAFDLPDITNKFLLVKSYFNGMMIGQYFHPDYLVLDTDNNVIESFTTDMSFYEGNMFRDDTNAHMSAAFDLPPNAKRLIVYTTRVQENAKSAKTSPTVSTSVIGGIPIVTPQPGSSISLSWSPTGMLSLQLKNNGE